MNIIKYEDHKIRGYEDHKLTEYEGMKKNPTDKNIILVGFFGTLNDKPISISKDL